ncbi:MAG: glutamate--tRNA ligase, partial [Euryarchaeota archaeon HGW-Euryarchaeota-1]
MTNQINEKINEEILRAKVKYGAVDLSSVLNKIIGVFPEVKNNIEDIVKEIQKEIKNSEKISKDEAEKILGEKGLNISKPKEENKELKLEGDTSNVVMRLAPNPSGPLHIGHARMIALNDFFVQKYKGKLICRIEDTDPERI